MAQRESPQAPAVRRARAGSPIRRRPEPTEREDSAIVEAQARPLTDRMLVTLPGPRLAWIAAWALVPWLNLAMILGAESAGWSESTDHSREVVNRVATSLAVALSLWGATRISDELTRVRPALARAVEQDLPAVDRLFRGLDSTLIPLALTLVVGVLLPLDELVNDDPVAAALQALTWLVIGIPLCTAVWVYATLELGLHRLGKGEVTLTGYRGDPTLGLQPIGLLAFTGFWMLLGTLAPLALASSADRPSVLVTTAVLAAGVGLLFVSVRGLHRQMAAIKHAEIERARQLYAQAYQPVRDQHSLEALQEQSGLLSAADNLEKHAERIQAWPFDEGTFARAVTIATSAVATIVARLLLAPTGL